MLYSFFPLSFNIYGSFHFINAHFMHIFLFLTSPYLFLGCHRKHLEPTLFLSPFHVRTKEHPSIIMANKHKRSTNARLVSEEKESQVFLK